MYFFINIKMHIVYTQSFKYFYLQKFILKKSIFLSAVNWHLFIFVSLYSYILKNHCIFAYDK